MTLDSICIMEDCGDQMTMLDVHVFKPISLLLTVQLVEQSLL